MTVVALPCAVGRSRREPVIVPAVELFDFGRVADLRPNGACPSCRLPVMLLGWGDDMHVSFRRPATATLCCPMCGGLAHRGLRADPGMKP